VGRIEDVHKALLIRDHDASPRDHEELLVRHRELPPV
jgi:hypothetical protein